MFSCNSFWRRCENILNADGIFIVIPINPLKPEIGSSKASVLGMANVPYIGIGFAYADLPRRREEIRATIVDSNCAVGLAEPIQAA